MGTLSHLFEALLYLSIGLLGALVTVYVLSATLLSSAMNAARLADDRIRRDTQQNLARLSERFATSVRSTDSELDEFATTLGGLRQKLVSTRSVRDIIRVIPSVAIPGVCFFATALVTSIPKGIVSSGQVPSAWWFLAIAPFLLGVYCFLRVVLAVETIVELASSEIQVDIEKDDEPWMVGQNYRVRFRVQLTKGTTLEGLQIALFNDPGEFTVSGGKTATQTLPDDLQSKGYVASMSTVWQLRAGTVFRYEFHHIQPREPGQLRLVYQIYSDTFYTPPSEIAIEAA